MTENNFFSYLGDVISPRFFLYSLLLLCIWVFGLRYWKRFDTKYQLLTILISIVLITEICGRFLIVSINNSQPVYHFLIPFQCLLYFLIFTAYRKNKKPLGLLFGLALIFSVVNAIFIQSLYIFPTNSLIALSFSLVTSTLFDFNRILKYPTEIQLFKLGDFWINLGTLLFFSLTFFAFSMMNIDHLRFPKWIYDLIFSANIALYFCYFVALYLERKAKP